MRLTAILLTLVVILGRSSSAPKPPIASNQEAEEIWHMKLPEAIRIGLENSETVRCISTGAQKIPLGGFEPQAADGTAPVGPVAADSKH